MGWIFISGVPTQNQKTNVQYFSSAEAKTFMTFCSINLLTSPTHTYDANTLPLWYFISCIMFPTLYTIMTATNTDHLKSHFAFLDYLVGSSEAAWISLAVFMPCILYAQRFYFWNWILPVVRPQQHDSKALTARQLLRILYIDIIAVITGVHAAYYPPLQRALLIAHFILHWLANVSNLWSILARPHPAT